MRIIKVAVLTLILSGVSLSVQAIPMQYNMTYDGSDSGPAGIGTFFWDIDVFLMTDFVWDFGSGLTGGLTNSILANTFIGTPNGGSEIYEIFTGQDVSDGDVAFGGNGYGGTSLVGPFPSLNVLYFGVFHPSDPLRYEFIHEGDTLAGIYSVSKATSVAEPATFLLMGIGIAGIAYTQRRKKV